MKISFSHLISLLWLLLFLFGFVNAVSASKEYQTYIIHLDHTHKPVSFLTHESWHRSILKSMLSSPADNKELLLYSYNHVMHGFSARLTPSQLTEIEKSPAHLATYPESFGKLLTTYSPKFLGLQQNFGIWPAASYGEDVIIGIIDSGIWPESESFKDEGMSPVPQRWKGTCENGTAFSPSACNRKLIGARSFSKGLDHISKKNDFNSTRDFFGHGTHTASIAAGNHVHDVSYFGYARGTAKGVAPGARLAMYKVVWDTTTEMAATTDILAGMEQAILDGVDIMSLSLGINQTSYFTDAMAIGSLSAIEKGIFVVCAGGNFGDYKTVINAAPWITTVGASTLDRSFLATMTLENGDSFEGTSYFPESVFITDSLLYYGKGNTSKAICIHRALDRKEVAGKVVLCDYSTKINVSQQIKEVERVGAYAAIFLTDMSFSLDATQYSIPSLLLPTASGKLIKEYVTRERNPKVKSMKFVFTKLGTKHAPQVANFSSKGPNPISPRVLKPDILAPGVEVLAAVSPIISFIKVGSYDLVTDYQLFSGTSMATPHVAGVGALLKAVHPEWSPAAVRSAMMTTAYAIDNTGTILKSQLTGLSGTPLDFGAGHINPNKAMDPGLIYDMGFQDYIEFLCNLGYTKKQMSVLIRRTQWSCSQKFIHDLNYPSFTAVLTNETRYPVAMNFSRVVTNVGNEKAVYRAHLENIPTGMRISVKPKILTFTRKYQNRSFVVSIELDREFPRVIFGFLKWVDQDSHVVSSPIVAINF